jgi:hypothetical protein
MDPNFDGFDALDWELYAEANGGVNSGGDSEEPTLIVGSAELAPPGSAPERDPVSAPAAAVAGDDPAPVAPRARPFRLRGKKLYLTYPRCDVEPAVVLERIVAMEGGVKWAVVARERHEDGAYHLHVAMWLNRQYDRRSADCLDHLAGQHGNYQQMRDAVKCLEYCLKDGDFVATEGFDPRAYIEARRKKTSVSFETVARKIVSGDSLRVVNEAHPGFVLQHLQKIRAYESFVSTLVSVELLPWPAAPTMRDAMDFCGPEHAILAWCQTNLFPVNGVYPVRPFKAPQLYIVGPTNRGKSSLVEGLRRFCRVYDVPMGEDFYDAYSDDGYDLIVFDEYRAQKRIQWMNRFVQGSPVSLRVKGGQVMKRRNLPVIVLSNYEPCNAYHKTYEREPQVLEAFEGRFQFVRLQAEEHLFRLCSWLTRDAE